MSIDFRFLHIYHWREINFSTNGEKKSAWQIFLHRYISDIGDKCEVLIWSKTKQKPFFMYFYMSSWDPSVQLPQRPRGRQWALPIRHEAIIDVNICTFCGRKGPKIAGKMSASFLQICHWEHILHTILDPKVFLRHLTTPSFFSQRHNFTG